MKTPSLFLRNKIGASWQKFIAVRGRQQYEDEVIGWGEQRDDSMKCADRQETEEKPNALPPQGREHSERPAGDCSSPACLKNSTAVIG